MSLKHENFVDSSVKLRKNHNAYVVTTYAGFSSVLPFDGKIGLRDLLATNIGAIITVTGPIRNNT
jgi:hypothetical protein